jgi:hypothetical protein
LRLLYDEALWDARAPLIEGVEVFAQRIARCIFSVFAGRSFRIAQAVPSRNRRYARRGGNEYRSDLQMNAARRMSVVYITCFGTGSSACVEKRVQLRSAR